MSSTKKSPLEALIIVLTLEKSAQHLITALFFVVDVPGIGKPDIGSNFSISSEVMALLNLALFGAFILGLYGRIKDAGWALKLIWGSAALDIVLEFLFHGLFYITVSIVVSTLLIILIGRFTRQESASHIPGS